MRHKQGGFTLVEIAIVLVIIGLLLGGVLKGQELINSAKVKSLVNDMRSVSTFVYAYQDRFRALPGDDNQVVAHVNGTLATTPAAPAARGNGVIEGNWNSGTTTDESYLFWQHVRLANLAVGSTTAGAAGYQPTNAEGGTIGITGVNPLTAPTTPFSGGIYVCSDNISGRMARQMDQTMDDGVTDTGSVRVLTNGAASQANAINLAPANDATLYTVCTAY